MAGLSELAIELAAVCVLQDQVDPVVIVEPSVQPEHVRVSKICLDLHLSLQLVVQLVLLYLLLEYHLQCHYKLALQQKFSKSPDHKNEQTQPQISRVAASDT